MGRKLFILFDGTWNDEKGLFNNEVVSNIVKLKNLIIPSENQIVYYSRGLGSDLENLLLGMFVKGVFAVGERKKRHRAMQFLKKTYRDGDTIYIFGFSRGAASARLFAKDIEKKGINGKMGIKIAFLGIWDTVSAFSVPLRVLGIKLRNRREKIILDEDITSLNVERAVHILSIDENRKIFEPDLIKMGPGVEEVWFPGVHSDVGGSYDKNECQIGDLSLNYMIDRLESYIRSRNYSKINFTNERNKIKTLPSELIIHKHQSFFNSKPRKIKVHSNSNCEYPLICDLISPLVRGKIKVVNPRNNKHYPYTPKNLKEIGKRYKLIETF
ncbi:hypothetical protein PM10SUCC1_29130 [Propionigenium maris DSM 9537]|uniref:T6SS Phospholipase effector Tle1-like catalytic domain-containing protein n=1 Tax=Propionigenium maris DSM 9537 TaxID=1123000 RepID=A0A9W6GLP5_9FUSO|nr:DUF2235 domain-containing protein [Propionigenium maris]GLI57399.1 hypothetical protein PM10SUCC1_29130 [Propionigenium maris DSM 9537]